ncbi:nucleoside 2-deoxyribosyltransferase [Faecalibacillus intestinalis]|uniref:nucleoside 2-deoxyribosyltransferase n=1 Tax=Faecalibacillus intestinalis TaxID=1982626 RepID=UPI002E76C9C1|nr:nucleoside 2-deoxyribosyltransferase [Faecalibacillus intestinalis]MEE1445200.1 nucleoside 2-deoxyribosyltransferase [Faecalibacillus intestinalis]
MSDVFQIYLAGGMQDLSFEEQNEWRKEICRCINSRCEKSLVDVKPVSIINPVDYYNFENDKHETEKEVMRFDTRLVKNSDLIIVNANDPKSIGTSMEIAIAYEHHIPVLILNKDIEPLHAWWIEMSDRVFRDSDSLCDYVTNFYLTMKHYNWEHNVMIK